MNPNLVGRLLIHLRSDLDALSEADLLEYSVFLDSDKSTLIEALRLRTDIKLLLGILIFTKREIADRCLPMADWAALSQATLKDLSIQSSQPPFPHS